MNNLPQPPSRIPESGGGKIQYGTPVAPYIADQERLDKIGKVLEGLTGGEFKRPRVLSRALDALEKELGLPPIEEAKAA